MSQNRQKFEDNDRPHPSRQAVLCDLEMAMNEAKRKIEAGRVYDVENEKVRIAWLKCLGYLVNSYRQLVKDHELEELEERIKKLEEERG